MAPRRRAREGKPGGKGRYLRARTQGFRFVNRLAFVVLVGMACVAVAVLSIPQVRELRRLREELIRSETREQHVLGNQDQNNRELVALRNDPGYLELVARDRLNLYRPGEQIFRIRR